jgi:hypothetical protein
VDVSNGTSISLTEAQAAFGVGARASLAPNLDLEPALELGGVWHGFSTSVPSATQPSGSTVVPGAWLPVTLRWTPVPAFCLGLRVAGAWVRNIEHVEAGTTLWQSGAWRVETSVFLGWNL